jgi:receptor protein-tyrosine kinase
MNTQATDVIELSSPEQETRHALGTILIEAGIIGTHDVDRIQRFARERGMKFGDAAVALNVARQEDVDFALGQQFAYPTLARGGPDGVGQDVVAAYAPQSQAIEPLRALRSQLMLRWLHSTPRRMLAVTSPEPGEGRSWLAANLATVFAQTGQPTLLIDADLRDPSQHRMFNLENSVGLSALLTGRTTGRDVFMKVHPQLELYVLPAGLAPPNPQELLLRPLFDSALDRFAQLFGVVIFDTPAATVSADAQIIAARAGAALLLSRRNRTRASRLIQTMRSLSDTGVHVLGSVVNEF